MRRLVVSLLPVAFVACSLADLDRFTSGGGAADAGTADVVLPDASPSEGDASDAGECVARATRVVTINQPGTPGLSCNEGDALEEDGKMAFLDTNGIDNCRNIDGQLVTGCVGVELSARARRIQVRMKAVEAGCQGTCGGSSCGTGRTVDIFYGPAADDLHFAGEVEIDEDFGEYEGTPEDDWVATLAVVCRQCFGAARDDIGVDVIRGECYDR